MAFDDPISIIILFTITGLVIAGVGYGLYRLTKFLRKANKFIDEQTRKQDSELQKAKA